MSRSSIKPIPDILFSFDQTNFSVFLMAHKVLADYSALMISPASNREASVELLEQGAELLEQQKLQFCRYTLQRYSQERYQHLFGREPAVPADDRVGFGSPPPEGIPSRQGDQVPGAVQQGGVALAGAE